MYRSHFSLPLALCLALGVLAVLPAVGTAGLSAPTVIVDSPAGLGTTVPPWSLEVKYFWDFSTADAVTTYPGTYWDFSLTQATFTFGVPFKVLTVEGVHKVAPHPGESVPSPSFVGGVIFPAVASAGGTAFGDVLHGPDTPHKDTWKLTALVNPAGTGADITVQAFHPVPEPSSLALLGVGSLIGLGVYTRRRRANT